MILPVDDLKEWFYILSMGMPRIVTMFTVLPMLHKRNLGGAMIRNGICMSLVLFMHPMLSETKPDEALSIYDTGGIVIKEAFIGALMGFVLAIPFWALEAAGFFIDNQRGASMASTLNPFSGAETSPMGILFSQAMIALVMTSGLFLLMLESLMYTYKVWPVFSYFPNINQEAVTFFLGQFDLIIQLAMWLSAPVIICMFITEFGIALISRAAPQLNVFILAMPIKSGVACAILVVYIATILELTRTYMMGIPELFESLGVLWK
ncbi:type III secretion system export apparatus subunit SctT [Endozoicomonas sp. SCSIO W0465]|uniref:type III secretion system export apparatus subunit SctT n=1 Tax=Endozoicomonas sp. SCSIO W0465 TaxID=2918516 RepID=UPI002075D1A8|nr:type III secretion system export apparatus subunit SctT [Endozoicomonas sp. SCSIO W0465]USE34669.1 type III secretion system export apparatus subunit SctT [Endozoicomonas sp. SCSIO W0465]